MFELNRTRLKPPYFNTHRRANASEIRRTACTWLQQRYRERIWFQVMGVADACSYQEFSRYFSAAFLK
jgi:hypothetical protein